MLCSGVHVSLSSNYLSSDQFVFRVGSRLCVVVFGCTSLDYSVGALKPNFRRRFFGVFVFRLVCVFV